METAEKTLSVQLTMTPELASELQREGEQRSMIEAYTITGTVDEQRAMAVEVNKELQRTKVRLTRLKETKAAFVLPAKQIIGTAEAFFDPGIQANQALEAHLKVQLIEFQRGEQAREDEARRVREAEERRQRQEAEAKAAAERARADEVARAKRREAEEAEAKRVAAEKEGNARAAAAAAGEKAKLEQQARAAVETGEKKAQQMELAASAAPSAVSIPERTELVGFGTRENYVAELDPGLTEDDVKAKLVAAISGGRNDLLALLKFDLPAANRLARALKKEMNVPGLRAVDRRIPASRSAG